MVSRNTTFKIDSVREDNDTGFISGAVLATKIGVFNYRDSATGEVIRELRSPEEVFKQTSMDSLQNVTWTNNHPPVKINKRNIRKFGTGFLHGNIEIHNDEFLKSDFTIQDEQNIEDYNAGKTPVSCGYDCKLIKKSGTWNGQRYDAIQTDIKYNHISSVNKPRLAGSSIITDSSDSNFKFDAIEVNEEGFDPSNKKNKENKQPMIKMKIDSHEVEVSESAKIAIENKLKIDSDNAKQIQKKLDEALQTNETLKGNNEALTLEIKESKKIDVQELMKKRRVLEKEVTPFLNKEQLEKIDSLEDFDLIKSAIVSKYDSVDLTNKSEESILGMFEVVKISQPIVNKNDASEIYNNAKKNNNNDSFDWDSDPLLQTSKEGN
jgi:hypothetical protein